MPSVGLLEFPLHSSLSSVDGRRFSLLDAVPVFGCLVTPNQVQVPATVEKNLPRTHAIQLLKRGLADSAAALASVGECLAWGWHRYLKYFCEVCYVRLLL
jgi:hypothetical protein